MIASSAWYKTINIDIKDNRLCFSFYSFSFLFLFIFLILNLGLGLSYDCHRCHSHCHTEEHKRFQNNDIKQYIHYILTLWITHGL